MTLYSKDAWGWFCVKRKGTDSRNLSLQNQERRNAHTFFNGINMLLITRPERKIYLLSPRICDQGISASVLLRDENWKWDGTIGAAKDDTGVGLKVLLPMETFSRFECAADLKFISFFKGLFFCSRSRVFIFFSFFCETKMRSKGIILYSRCLTAAEPSPLVIGM